MPQMETLLRELVRETERVRRNQDTQNQLLREQNRLLTEQNQILSQIQRLVAH